MSRTKQILRAILMPNHCLLTLTLALALTLLFNGCASFRSGLQMGFKDETKRNDGAKQVSVLFNFSHIQQTLGYDAIPKLIRKREALRNFDDVFGDALQEFSNIRKYDTFTDDAEDVNAPERRFKKDSLTTANDYMIKIRISNTKSFAKHFLGTLFSSVTVTILPIPYSWNYGLVAEVYNHDRQIIATYERRASLTKWVEALLIFVYPFYPEERKREEIYMLFLHDTFRQIESEGVLK